MDSNGLSLRILATVLGVSPSFFSRMRTGKRLLPEILRKKIEVLGAYHLLISDKHAGTAVDDMEKGMRQNSRLEIGGTDWVRTSDLALMKRPL